MPKLITIEFPVGAGGTWLEQVINLCISGGEWKSRTKNFYHDNTFVCTQQSHNSIKENNYTASISLDNYNFKYSYWKSYYLNRVIGELDYVFKNNKRVYIYNSDNSIRDNFFELTNACNNIHRFKPSADIVIDYQDIWNNTPKVWQQVNTMLTNNGYRVNGTYSMFEDACENFKRTRNKINKAVRRNSTTYKIWAVSYLSNQKIYFHEDLFENFHTKEFSDFVSDYREVLDNYITSVNC